MEVNEKELKAKYGKVFKLTIPTDEGEEILYLKKIDRLTYKAATKIMESDELKGAETILRALTVEGDHEKVIADFDALRTASGLLVDVIGVKSGNVAVL